MAFFHCFDSSHLSKITSVIFFGCFLSCAASNISCDSDRSSSDALFCPQATVCDESGFCKSKFYSRCKSSSDCIGDEPCVKILPNNSLTICPDATLSLISNSACFCHKALDYFSGIHGCPINTVRTKPSFEDEWFCIPCLYFNSDANDFCKTYNFTSSPPGKPGSLFHSCNNSAQCGTDLTCTTVTNNGAFRSCEDIFDPLDFYDLNVTKSCFCSTPDTKLCSFFSTCTEKELCVRPFSNLTNGNFFCVPSEAVDRVSPRPDQQSSSFVPRWVLNMLGAIELTLIVFKSFFLLKSKQIFLKIALLLFVLESIVGFALTILTSYVLFENVPRDLGPGFKFLPFLFVLTEMCSVISESIMVGRKLRGVKHETKQQQSITEPQLSSVARFSLVGRVIMKWMLLLGLLLILSFSFLWWTPFFICLCIFSVAYVIFLITSFRRLWLRMLVSNLILLVSVNISIFYLYRKRDQMIFLSLCDREQFRVSIFYIGMASCNFLIALSAFLLKGFKNMKKITIDQVEFSESAITGITFPLLLLSIFSYRIGDECSRDLTIVVLWTSCPQILVLLFPLLLEYIEYGMSNLINHWAGNVQFM